MVEYKKVNVQLSDSQPDKLKSAVKNKQDLTLRMWWKCLKERMYLMSYY